MGTENKEVVEYRGIENLVYAKVTKDDADEFTTGTVKALAGVAKLLKDTASSSETKYYDNVAAAVINSAGVDTVTISTSAIPLEVVAEITGQTYDTSTGTYFEGDRDVDYFAIGYITKDTKGNEVYVWRLKGTFAIPSSEHNTENEGTDATGQELIYTGVRTTHKFAKTGKGARAINVETSKALADTTNFFNAVVTPDTLTAKA